MREEPGGCWHNYLYADANLYPGFRGSIVYLKGGILPLLMVLL